MLPWLARKNSTPAMARNLGDELLFQNLAERNINYLNSLSFKRLLTIDPHAYHAIGQEYRALGGEFEVVHHPTAERLLTSGDLSITKAVNRGRVTYHDPPTWVVIMVRLKHPER